MIYAPIRQHHAGEWVQWMKTSHTRAYCEHLCKRMEEHTPDWCAKYPLVRIGHFRCIEIDEKGEDV